MYRIDISNYNGVINWKLAEPAIDLCIARAWIWGGPDAQFDTNWAALRSMPNILRGAYYFHYFDKDPVREAKSFLDKVQPQKDEIVALDLEEQDTAQVKAGKANGKLWEPVKAWLDVVELETGHKPFIYTSPGWWNYWMCKSVLLIKTAPPWTKDYPLWVAHYTTATKPQVPIGWNEWLIWQFGAEKVPGCGVQAGSNPVTDSNRLSLSIAELRQKWNPVLMTDAEVLNRLIADWRAAHPGQ